MTSSQIQQATDRILTGIRSLQSLLVNGTSEQQEQVWTALAAITAAFHSGLTDVVVAVARGTPLDEPSAEVSPVPVQEEVGQ